MYHWLKNIFPTKTVVHIQNTLKKKTNPYLKLSKNKPYLHLLMALGILELECYLKITAFCLSWKTGVSLPNLKSNQILLLFFSPILFSTFTIYTPIFNPYIYYICNCTNYHINIRLDYQPLFGKWARAPPANRPLDPGADFKRRMQRCCLMWRAIVF